MKTKIAKPPIALKILVRQMGVNPITLWRWRKAGMIKATNILGKLNVLPDDLARFNRRAASGEFARELPMPDGARRKK